MIITDAAMAEGIQKLSVAVPKLRAWNIEDFGKLSVEDSTELAPPKATEKNLAVIIYTSNDGHPKGHAFAR